MEITCTQMDVLISFYLEGSLSNSLKKRVEEHLATCSNCRAKYDILKTLIGDLKSSCEDTNEEFASDSVNHYSFFKHNLSAYVDNELPSEDNIKIKKYTINNKKARKELEDTYNIRKLMSESFSKTHTDVKQDFSGNVMRQLDQYDESNLFFHPVLKVAMAFVITVLILSAIIIFYLTLE